MAPTLWINIQDHTLLAATYHLGGFESVPVRLPVANNSLLWVNAIVGDQKH